VDRPLALFGGTIYTTPEAEPVRDAILYVENGRVSASALTTVPPNAEVLDCTGGTILAGFCNCHVHFFERKWANAANIPPAELLEQLQQFLTRWGFTSCFDLSSPWVNTRNLRDRIEEGEIPGPRIRSTGQGLLAPGAMPPDPVTHLMGVIKAQVPSVADSAAAASAAKRLIQDGVNGIKIFMKQFPPDGVGAAVAEARRAAMPVFVHPEDKTDVLAALRAGVDVIAHTTPSSGAWDEELLSLSQRASLTPTLELWKHYFRHDRLSRQEQIVETAVGQLRAWIAAGGAVLFGNDLGAVEPDPAGEYALMAAAGMGFRQILASLTTTPAERLGGATGRIGAGLEADLTVVNGDPAKDVRALANVRYTLRAGKLAWRAPA